MMQRRMLAAGLGAVVLLAAGCGEGQVVPDRGQLAVAAAATTDARTARMSATFSTSMPGAFGEMSMTMEGVVDFVAEAGQLSISQEGGFGSLSMEMIQVDGYIYLLNDSEEPQGGVPPGKWMRQEAPEGTGLVLDPMNGGHPAGMLDMLRELGAPVERVGSEQVRGADTTRYALRTTGEELMRLHDAEEQLDPGVDMAELTVDFDLWIDDDNLMRRMRSETDISAMAEQMGEEAVAGTWRSTMELELYDFGVPVNISAPPEDEVVDHDPLSARPDPGIGLDDEYSGSWESSDEFIIETAPGMLEGFPEEFPIHPAAWVMGSEQTPTGYEVVLYISGWAQDDIDRVVLDHERSLEGHGWTITGRSSGDGHEVLEIAGHGWTGMVTLRHNPDESEIMILVTLDRDEQ